MHNCQSSPVGSATWFLLALGYSKASTTRPRWSVERGDTHPAMTEKLLNIPLKTTVSLSLAAPLSTYIQNVYNLNPADYADALRRLDELREHTCSMAAALPSLDSLNRLAAYQSQLRRLLTRFPMTADSGPDAIKVAFSWYNCTATGLKEKERQKSSIS